MFNQIQSEKQNLNGRSERLKVLNIFVFLSDKKGVKVVVFFISHLICVLATALTVADVRRDPSMLMTSSNREIEILSGQLTGSAKIKMQNFYKIRGQLEACFLHQSDSRGLRQSLLSGSISDPCLASVFGLKNLQQVAEDFGDLAQATSFAAVKKFVEARTISNAARSIYDYRSQFEGARPLPKLTDGKALNALAQESCKGCSKSQLESFKKYYVAYAKANPIQETQYTMSNLAHLQNQTLEGLNQRLAEMEEAKNLGSEEKFNAAYTRYLEDYQRFTSTPAGGLFLTHHMRGLTGSIVTPEDASKKLLIARKIEFPRHKLLDTRVSCRRALSCSARSDYQIKKALHEVETKIQDYTRDVLDANSFQELLKTNPVLAGQLLVVNPNLMNEVCAAAQDIMRTDERNHQVLNQVDSFIGAVDMASMALLASGVGSVGAVVGKAGVLALKAGVSVARSRVVSSVATSAGRSQLIQVAGQARVLGTNTTVSQLMSRTAVVGAISEVGHIGSDGAKLRQISGQSSMLMASRMARATNDLDVKRLSELESEWQQSFDNLKTASLVNAIPLAHGFMKVRSSQFVQGLLGRSKSLQSELAYDKRLQSLVSDLGGDTLKVVDGLLASKKINADGLTAALAVAAKSEKDMQLLKNGLSGKNPADFLEKFAKSGEGALACAI